MDKSKKNTQVQRVIKYINDFGSITPLEALADLGIMRLSARIWDIRHKCNLNIVTDVIKSQNRYGDPVRFAKYSWCKDGE